MKKIVSEGISYRSGVNLTMSCKGHLNKCWVNTQPITGVASKGFTLIELLVVVLIIGILAAVALPQYQKAVLKSRFSSMIPLGKALRDGNEAYYLEHGSYATDKGQLDVTNNEADVAITVGSEEQRTFVQLTREDINNNLVLYQKQSPNFPGEIHCEAKKDNNLAIWLCEDGLKGTLIGEVASGYKVYSLDENFNGTLARTYYNVGTKKTLAEGDVCIDTVGRGCYNVTLSNGRCISKANASYGCADAKANHYSICEGNTGTSCGGASVFTDHSTCIAAAGGACYWGQFKSSSTCVGNARGGCKGASFNNSVCEGNVAGSCVTGGHVPTYTNHSSCIGNATNTCTDSTFSTHSTCQANAVGACVGATYKDDTSYCTGDYCPEGAASSTAGKVWHREADWAEDQVSVLVDKPETTD